MGDNYGQVEKMAGEGFLTSGTISTHNRLERRKTQLEKELKAVNDAIGLFSTHPEIADALDLLGQIQM